MKRLAVWIGVMALLGSMAVPVVAQQTPAPAGRSTAHWHPCDDIPRAMRFFPRPPDASRPIRWQYSG